MSPQLVMATRNRAKLAEMDRILRAAAIPAEILGFDAFGELPEVAETELSFAGNAVLKAQAIAEATELPAVADDSGLCIDAMGGMPGVFSARWSGRHGHDQANLELLLAQLEDVLDVHRRAHFRCAAVLATPDGQRCVVEGRLDGRVIREPRGTGGFGYDPIFVPDGEERTTAEMAPEEKDAISHRGRALRQLLPHLAAVLGAPGDRRR